MFISVICIQEARIGENSNVEHLNLKNYKMITQAIRIDARGKEG